MKNIEFKLLFWLVLYLYMPILDISGHRIILTEFYTYLLFIINFKDLKFFNLLKPFLIYFVLYFITIIFTAFLSGSFINNHDIYTLRNILQFYFAFNLFKVNIDELKIKYTRSEFEKFILKSILVLALPSIIIYLQRLNILGARDLFIYLYRPKFFFLDANSFSEFRYTSIFQDFFTEALYFTTVIAFIFYFILKNKLSRSSKIVVNLIFLFVYSSQVFVSRTSLMITLLINIIILFIGADLKPIEAAKKFLSLIIFIAPLILIAGPILIESKLINTEWAFEGFNAFSDNKSNKEFSSYTTMNSLVENFILFLKNNPNFLLRPNHEYNLTITANPLLYTDSFYGQEIYRFGIYGIISYLIFVFALIRASFHRYKMIFILAIFFVILNYKGGNVFFMEKNIYAYAFIFSILITYPFFLNQNDNI